MSKREVSEWAVTTAARNGERDYPNYEVELFARDLFMVNKKPYNGTVYAVDAETGECECEFFKKEGVCKHLWMVSAHIRDTEDEGRAALLFDEEDHYGDHHQTPGLHE